METHSTKLPWGTFATDRGETKLIATHSVRRARAERAHKALYVRGGYLARVQDGKPVYPGLTPGLVIHLGREFFARHGRKPTVLELGEAYHRHIEK